MNYDTEPKSTKLMRKPAYAILLLLLWISPLAIVARMLPFWMDVLPDNPFQSSDQPALRLNERGEFKIVQVADLYVFNIESHLDDGSPAQILRS